MSQESYHTFASVYDHLMEDIPYEKWRDSLVRFLTERGIADGLVAELGCGTGTMTELLCAAGYDMIGIDSSGEMLAQAMEKRANSGSGALYLLQDMRSFELYGTVRAFISVCDTMNYLEDTASLTDVLRLVNNYLDPGGVFIFELKLAGAVDDAFRQIEGKGYAKQYLASGKPIWAVALVFDGETHHLADAQARRIEN